MLPCEDRADHTNLNKSMRITRLQHTLAALANAMVSPILMNDTRAAVLGTNKGKCVFVTRGDAPGGRAVITLKRGICSEPAVVLRPHPSTIHPDERRGGLAGPGAVMRTPSHQL